MTYNIFIRAYISFRVNSHPGYEIHYAFNWVQGIYTICVAAGFDIVFTLISIYIMYRMDCFIEMCKVIGSEEHTAQMSKSHLTKMVILHSETLE